MVDETLVAKVCELGSTLRVPTQSDRLWKEECAFCFGTPESEKNGLFLNSKTLQAYCARHVTLDNSRNGTELFMHLKYHREEEAKDETKMEVDTEVTKLAIGVEGGFSPPDDLLVKGKLVKEYGFVLFSDLESIVPYPCPVKLDDRLMLFADTIIAMDDASAKTEIAAWEAEDEPRPVSKFAENLEQLDNGVKISSDPKTWKCEESGLTTNLWLNLSTGYIGSGRPQYDGSGGTGAALTHFETTGRKYPLAVKLGTITPDGKADVYSYDPSEDCMVEDPFLAKHLHHFGINIQSLDKTEKSLLEMEVEANKSLDFSAILEAGEKLEQSYGPGRVGLLNLGNSCYCNSVYQCLFSLDAFRARFLFNATTKRRELEYGDSPSEPQTDLSTQLTKLAASLANPEEENVQPTEDGMLAVSPKMLKDCFAKGHRDFSSRDQQDAREYLQHVLEKIERMDHGKDDKIEYANPGQWFTFLMEERLLCKQSQMVKYKLNVSNVLMLTVPQLSVEDESKTVVPFENLLQASLGSDATEDLEDYLSPATGQRGQAEKTPRMGSFPKYLAVQLKRYVVADDWTPKKLDYKIPVPRQIDLTRYRGKGLQKGEAELPEQEEQPGNNATAAVEPDPAMLAELMNFGFNENGCKRALIAVQNADLQMATNWVLEHMSDPDFDQPLQTSASASGPSVDEGSVQMLSSMGFSADAAKLALKECNNDLERAADWLFSHAADIDQLLAAEASGGSGATVSSSSTSNKAEHILSKNDKANGEYFLRGFISHIGKTTHGGHYVCHVNQSRDLTDSSKDEWLLFNDRKVAISKTPPFDHGFIYIFERRG